MRHEVVRPEDRLPTIAYVIAFALVVGVTAAVLFRSLLLPLLNEIAQ